MKIGIAGQGAFGIKHLEAIARYTWHRSDHSDRRQSGRHGRSREEIQDSAFHRRPG